ncbi:MAG: MFS transporter [Chloroflexi bacterium]|nr:MFS transporter [Chloroflexota bacterium]
MWASQGLAQTAQNAILFSLLVVVLAITGSSVKTSLLVLSFILPSIPLGFIVGVILDRTRKDSVLVISNLLRAGGCIVFLFFHSDEWIIYGIAMAFATAGLFFNPAVVSLIPSIVPKERLVAANSLYNFTLTASQLAGIVFLAPVILQTAGADGAFIAGAVLFVLAAAFAARLSVGYEETAEKLPQGTIFGGIPTDFRESWQVLVSDRYSFLALSQLILASTLVLLFAILIPRFMLDVLDEAPEAAALVFAPTGIGALVGLRFLPWFTSRGKNRTVVIGLTGIAVCLALLALVEPLADVTRQAPGSTKLAELLRISLLQLMAMTIAAPMGFAYALLNAPAQTVLHERAPAEMRGRIFATQVVSANFISLLPLLVVGVVTDEVGIAFVLLILGALVGGMAFISSRVGREDGDEGEGERESREPGEVST